jgi:hypothetical protein
MTTREDTTMQLTALVDFHRGLRDQAEIIRRGDTFTARGTGIMNAAEVAARYIRDGIACPSEDADEKLAKTEKSWNWAQAEVERMRKLRR